MSIQVDFAKYPDGLVPAIIQDADTHKVLMLGYMNDAALAQTQKEGLVTFFSRSKQRLWVKGETSGNFLHLVEIKSDCDQDALLLKVRPVAEVCHTGADTCFFEENKGKAAFLNYLQAVIRERKEGTEEKSYTKSLFQKGINKIAQKVGEEAVELVIEAKDNAPELFLGEAADLLFHYLVLLEAKNVDLDEVIALLQKRHQKS